MNRDIELLIVDVSIAIAAISIGAFIIWLVVSPVSADVLVYGSEYNYSIAVLPNNSYVHQGENISQGNYYDLGGLFGFSGQLAHWKNNWDAGYGTPDDIITLTSRPHEYTYIDPKTFPVGKWYQWDGETCDSSGTCSLGFGHGNAYVFAVVVQSKNVTPKNNTITYKSNIVVKSGNTTVEIPVTAQVTVVVTEPTQVIENATTIVIPTPVQTVTPIITNIEIVTPKPGLPLPITITVFALLITGFLIFRRK